MSNDGLFKALADPTRREILRLLGRGEMSAGELAANFQMSKPSLSHHFAVLKKAGLVTSRREGQMIFYALNTTVFQDLITWVMDISRKKEPAGYGREKAGRKGKRKKR